MKLRIARFKLMAGALAALGLAVGGMLVGAEPASAQETPQTPWYMPQAWVTPPQTGPKIRKLPGYYGHNQYYGKRSYGSFSNGCYGDCRDDVPGTVMTGNGYVLERPVVAIYDGREYQLVPRNQLQTLPAPPIAASRSAPAEPAIVSARKPTPRLVDMKPRFTTQNGVRVIRPEPVGGY